MGALLLLRLGNDARRDFTISPMIVKERLD
jgi:hypothetical protein